MSEELTGEENVKNQMMPTNCKPYIIFLLNQLIHSVATFQLKYHEG